MHNFAENIRFLVFTCQKKSFLTINWTTESQFTLKSISKGFGTLTGSIPIN